MKALIGLLLIGAGGYMGYEYVTATKSSTGGDPITQDYSGQWNVMIVPTSGGQCAAASAVVNVENGFIKGTLQTTDGVSAALVATIDGEGKIKNGASTNLGSFDGVIFGGVGNGLWSDKYGCAGTFTMRRPEGSVDTTGFAAPKAPSSGPVQQQQYTGGGVVGDINCKVSGIGCSAGASANVQTAPAQKPAVQPATQPSKPAPTQQTTTVTATPAPTPAPAAVSYAGSWRGTAQVTGGSDMDRCMVTTVNFDITGSNLSGSFATSYLGSQPVRGSVTSTGGISGYGGFVAFTGKLSGNSGSGTWKGVGNIDCTGTFSVSK